MNTASDIKSYLEQFDFIDIEYFPKTKYIQYYFRSGSLQTSDMSYYSRGFYIGETPPRIYTGYDYIRKLDKFCYFEEVFRDLKPEIQRKILWHLDFFK